MAGDADTALRAFTPDAVVVDDGSTYRGTDEIRAFLATAGAEFTLHDRRSWARSAPTTTHWVAVNHLEGDFPGGVVDLRYRFALDGDLIAELVIAP